MSGDAVRHVDITLHWLLVTSYMYFVVRHRPARCAIGIKRLWQQEDKCKKNMHWRQKMTHPSSVYSELGASPSQLRNGSNKVIPSISSAKEECSNWLTDCVYHVIHRGCLLNWSIYVVYIILRDKEDNFSLAMLLPILTSSTRNIHLLYLDNICKNTALIP